MFYGEINLKELFQHVSVITLHIVCSVGTPVAIVVCSALALKPELQLSPLLLCP